MGWAAIAGTALSVVGSMRQASAIEARERARQRQLEQERRLNEIKMLEDEMQRRHAYEEVTGANIARGFASGYDPNTSGSWLALSDEEKRKKDKDIEYIQLFGNAQDANLQMSILASENAISAANSSAIISSASSIFNTGYELDKVGFFD